MSSTLKLIIEDLVVKELQGLSLSESWRGFNLKFFKKLESFTDRRVYADMKLPKLGSGSARVVYGLGSGKVLKIAHGNVGARQNRNEVEAYTSGRFKNLVAKIYDFDDKYAWIVSEAVKVIKDNSDLKKKFTISGEFLQRIQDQQSIGRSFDESLEMALKVYNDLEEVRKKHGLDFHFLKLESLTKYDLELLQKLYTALQLGMQDIDRFDHWGVTTGGRLVIVDYGISADEVKKP